MQLMRLSRALKEKQPEYQEVYDKVILQHDNARPHVAKPIKTYLQTLKLKVLPHPPYSPDVAPSDYHLFRSMSHGMALTKKSKYTGLQGFVVEKLWVVSEVIFDVESESAIRISLTVIWIDSRVASKDASVCQDGILQLPEIEKKILASDGHYFES